VYNPLTQESSHAGYFETEIEAFRAMKNQFEEETGVKYTERNKKKLALRRRVNERCRVMGEKYEENPYDSGYDIQSELDSEGEQEIEDMNFAMCEDADENGLMGL